jgi:hypothetical protein
LKVLPAPRLPAMVSANPLDEQNSAQNTDNARIRGLKRKNEGIYLLYRYPARIAIESAGFHGCYTEEE